ncbi:unnamed protein product [Symbiodinium natans]|uniref:Uncharacterized protein n=1 Tax=Symbiodinium natans TaxID=878477 RepID=A0A812LGG9_9DINO|nr:unnamed protein product [Symbiodinium natans]
MALDLGLTTSPISMDVSSKKAPAFIFANALEHLEWAPVGALRSLRANKSVKQACVPWMRPVAGREGDRILDCLFSMPGVPGDFRLFSLFQWNRRNFLKAYHSNLLREKVYENSRVEHYGSLPSALEAWQQRAGDFSLQFFSSRTLWKRMKFCGVPALEIGMPDLVCQALGVLEWHQVQKKRCEFSDLDPAADQTPQTKGGDLVKTSVLEAFACRVQAQRHRLYRLLTGAIRHRRQARSKFHVSQRTRIRVPNLVADLRCFSAGDRELIQITNEPSFVESSFASAKERMRNSNAIANNVNVTRSQEFDTGEHSGDVGDGCLSQVLEAPEELVELRASGTAVGAVRSEFLEPELPKASEVSLVQERSEGVADPIGLLQQHVAKHLSRSVVTGDITYAFERLACGRFVATVSFGDDELQPCTGFPEARKASAKKSAAGQALAQLFEAANWAWKSNKSNHFQANHRVVERPVERPVEQRPVERSRENKGAMKPDLKMQAAEPKKKHNKQWQGQFFHSWLDARHEELDDHTQNECTVLQSQATLQGGASTTDNPIGKVNEIVAAVLRRPLSKDDVRYTFAERDSVFTSAVAIAVDGLLLEASGEPAMTKRQAKSNAARALLVSKELEAFVAEVSQGASDTARMASSDRVQPQPWSEDVLQKLLRNLLQRNPRKDDIIYAFEESEEGTVCSVRVPILERLPACKGKPAPSRKKAKQYAADELVSCILKT